jgi:hypothetical protein
MIGISGEPLAASDAAEKVPMACMVGALLSRGGIERHPAHRIVHRTWQGRVITEGSRWR